MTSPEPIDADGSLPDAKRRLEDAVSGLVDPQCEVVDGRPQWVDSRYDQLREAIAGEQGSAAHSAPRSKPPLWVDAAQTLMEIDTAVAAWEPRPLIDLSQGDPPPMTVVRLQAIESRKWRPQDSSRIEQLAKNINEWIADIGLLFDKDPVRALWAAQGGGFAACPQCDKTMAKRRDRGGEMVQYPAMQLNTDGSTRCMACQTSWGPELAMWVCRSLGYPTPTGVLD